MADGGDDPHRGRRLTGQILEILGCVFAALSVVGMLAQGGSGIPMQELLVGLLGGLIICGIPVVIGAYLVKGAGPAPPVVIGERPKMTALRIIFAAFASLLMIFSGGCGLVFLYSWLANPSPDAFVGWQIVALFAIPPFLAGMLVWWLAVKAGRS